MEVRVWMIGRLGYNPANDRYGFLTGDLWAYDGFHCGESMKVEIGDEWVDTKMEMRSPNTWYLVDTPYAGDQLEGLYVKIKMWVDSHSLAAETMEPCEEDEDIWNWD